MSSLAQLSDAELFQIAGIQPQGNAPLSVRNNNPGNMRSIGANAGFQGFDTPEAGLDAMRNDLLLKVTGKSRAMNGKPPTLANLISTWAPPTENNTVAYIDNVSKKTGISPNTLLTPQDIDRIMPAMIEHEGGKNAVSYFGQPTQYADAGNVMNDATSVDAPDLSQLSDDELFKAAGVPKPIDKEALQAQFEAKKASRGRTVLDQTLQGATFGGADEASDFLGQGMAKIYAAIDPNIDIADLPSYDQVRADSSARLNNELQTRPEVAIPANIAGALLTGGAGATTKTGATAANWLRNGNILTRATKGAALGATSGGLYGFGSGENSLPERLDSARVGAEYGGAFGAAAPVVASAVNRGIQGSKRAIQGIAAREGEALQTTAQTMKSNAGAIRNQMKAIGAEFKPETNNKLINNVDEALAEVELIPEFNPKTIAVVREIKASADKGKLDLDKLDQYRRLLRNARDEDSVAASAVRRAIDKTMNSLNGDDFSKGGPKAVELLNKFRQDYTKASKFEDIADILAKADGDPNKIKSGLTRFVQNKDNTRGWSEQEIKVLREAAKSSLIEKLAKMGGKFGIDLGASFSPGNTIGPLIGGVINPAIPIAGTVARQGQKYLARGKAEQLLRVIEGGGKVSPAQLKSLPPADAKKVLQHLYMGTRGVRTEATIHGYGKK